MVELLIVDDDASVRELLTHIFISIANTQVTIAISGNEAIAILEAGKKFCMIISDFEMRDGNGHDLYQFILVKNIATPFIFFTSKTDLQLSREKENYLRIINKTNITGLIEEFRLII